MAVIVSTQNPAALLAEIKRQITQGHIVTWTVDKDGDFTHAPEQWRNRGWMCPKIFPGLLVFTFTGNTGEITGKAVYGVYHGRLIEALLTHCDQMFAEARATALATAADTITQRAG